MALFHIIALMSFCALIVAKPPAEPCATSMFERIPDKELTDLDHSAKPMGRRYGNIASCHIACLREYSCTYFQYEEGVGEDKRCLHVHNVPSYQIKLLDVNKPSRLVDVYRRTICADALAAAFNGDK